MYQENGREYIRRSIRLSARDYSEAACYFVTIRAHDVSLSEIVNGEVVLNDAGYMVQREWDALPDRFPSVALDAFVVMPDHVHGIIVLRDQVTMAHEPRPIGQRQALPLHDENNAVSNEPTLGSIVQAFKSLTTRAYMKGVRELDWPASDGRMWQRNYYERVLRSNEELIAIRLYIETNPHRYRPAHSSGSRDRSSE